MNFFIPSGVGGPSEDSSVNGTKNVKTCARKKMFCETWNPIENNFGFQKFAGWLKSFLKKNNNEK